MGMIHQIKGRIRLPKRMIFWKTSIGEGGGVIFNQKFMFQILDLYIGFFPGRFPKNLLHNLSENEGEGGQRPFGFFLKIHSFGHLTLP